MKPAPFLALALAGCAATPPAPPPIAPAITAAPSAASAPTPIASARPTTPSPSASTAASTAPSADDEGPTAPLPPALDAKDLPVAPCDLTRVYRGLIGTTPVTLKLARAGDALRGLARYDLPGLPIALTGTVQGSAVVVDEKGGGRFTGTCDAATGKLAGTYALKRTSSAFTLAPRPAGEAAIHQIHERVITRSPVSPACARLGPTTETRTLEGAICLPNDTKALAELQRDTGAGRCSLELTSPRVFGLETPAIDALVNAQLSHDAFGYASLAVRASVSRCAFNGEVNVSGGFRIVHDDRGVLSVFFSGFLTEAGAAHGALFGPEGVTVDLQTGRRLVIADVVSNEPAFREAILGCVPRDRDEYDWGTKDAYRKAPRWVIVPGGIAVVLGDVSPVMHGAEGTGPVASFAGLAARGLLRADSPIARLWAGVTPAAAGAPLCPTHL